MSEAEVLFCSAASVCLDEQTQNESRAQSKLNEEPNTKTGRRLRWLTATPLAAAARRCRPPKTLETRRCFAELAAAAALLTAHVSVCVCVCLYACACACSCVPVSRSPCVCVCVCLYIASYAFFFGLINVPASGAALLH